MSQASQVSLREFEEEKCPICLDIIDPETGTYFCCHNCSSLLCIPCQKDLGDCPCCRDKLKFPRSYLVSKFKKILHIKPDIINNIIGCIFCNCNLFQEAKKYFKKSRLGLAKQNLDLINFVNIDYNKFSAENGYWFTSLYQLHQNFCFMLNRIEFPHEHVGKLANLYINLQLRERALNILENIESSDGLIQYNLAHIFYSDISDMEKDYKKILDLYLKSIENGCYDALSIIGIFYTNGHCGLEEDYEKAEYYFLEDLKHNKTKKSYLNLIKLSFKKGNSKDGIKWIDEGIKNGFCFDTEMQKIFRT